ncbi:interleukin-27 receptor subunit alpha [Ornithorhynchus anatinus]|uniref:Interleukin 27 receptor subunit alpha n=1 Tax=Ornithorhynchus anatinus TaxID=9258 RepID=A0A6I8PM77_ORNAN|nr:interleukin-27 receptor subunit alpha [Ornithorhynchus anatinus]
MGHFILQALEPARRYEVAIRCRLQDEKGFWSDWSPSISFWSVPAAPSSLVNLWVSASLCSPKPGGNSPLLLWKPLPNEANLSYEVVFRVRGCDLPPVVLPCCQASLPRDAEWAGVLAFNPTGRTPFANLTLKCAGSAPEGVRVKSTGNQGLLVTWEPGRGGEPQEYVVEWTSDVQTPQELHWIRLQAGEHRALLNGSFPPAVPFQVVVSGIFPQGLGRSLPAQGYGQETVPSAGPALQRLQDDPGGAPVVAWEQLPFRQRGGHLISYNLYVQAGTSPPTLCIVSADTQNLTLRNLVSSGRYKLWMTATTSAGEGFPGPSLLLQLPENTVRWKVLLGCLLLPGLLLLGCGLGLAFSKRCLHICHKLPPRWLWEDTPDPFNSRAAWTEEEDVPRALPPQEPPLLEVEEMEPLTAPQPGVAGQQPLHTFGYERHFLPTPEELGLYSAGQVDCTQVTMQPGEEEVQDDGERGPEETAGTEKCENLLALGEKGEINTGPEMTGVSQSLEGSPPRLLSSPL